MDKSRRNKKLSLVETFFVHLVDDQAIPPKEWKKLKLNKKIEALESFFPAEVIASLHNLRMLGNKGAHQSGHADISHESLEVATRDLSKICEVTIFEYFRKHGLDGSPWLPTVFSTLPPLYSGQDTGATLQGKKDSFRHGQVGNGIFKERRLRKKYRLYYGVP